MFLEKPGVSSPLGRGLVQRKEKGVLVKQHALVSLFETPTSRCFAPTGGDEKEKGVLVKQHALVTGKIESHRLSRAG